MVGGADLRSHRDEIVVSVGPERLDALVYRAAEVPPYARHLEGATSIPLALVFGHGAGGHQRAPFIVELATSLALRGVDVITYDLPHALLNRRLDADDPRLQVCTLGVLATARGCFPTHRLFLGGRSLSAHVAAELASAHHPSAAMLSGLVLLSYSVQGGGDAAARALALRDLALPTLVIAGTRDRTGLPDDVRALVRGRSNAIEVYAVEGADHTLAGLREARSTAVADRIASWMRSVVATTAEHRPAAPH